MTPDGCVFVSRAVSPTCLTVIPRYAGWGSWAAGRWLVPGLQRARSWRLPRSQSRVSCGSGRGLLDSSGRTGCREGSSVLAAAVMTESGNLLHPPPGSELPGRISTRTGARVRYWHGLSPWYKVLAIDLALTAVVVALALVFGTFGYGSSARRMGPTSERDARFVRTRPRTVRCRSDRPPALRGRLGRHIRRLNASASWMQAADRTAVDLRCGVSLRACGEFS